MNRIIHYTSNANWKRIQESGLLLPKSVPNESHLKLSDRVSSMIQDDAYLVGIPKPLEDGWVKYGLMDYLLEHTTGEVVLNVPILDSQRGFVRDHAHISPRRFMEQYGEDLWKKFFDGEVEFDDPILIEAGNRYLESSVPLDRYAGDYSVPEIWLPQKTSIDKLTKI